MAPHAIANHVEPERLVHQHEVLVVISDLSHIASVSCFDLHAPTIDSPGGQVTRRHAARASRAAEPPKDRFSPSEPIMTSQDRLATVAPDEKQPPPCWLACHRLTLAYRDG